MCTSIVHLTAADGMAKDGAGWYPVDQAVVAYDHARHAIAGDVITIDFFNRALGPGTRAAVELTLESAKALAAVLQKAIEEAEIEESEVRGVGAPPAARTSPAGRPHSGVELRLREPAL